MVSFHVFYVSRETLDCELNLFEQITIARGEVLPSFFPLHNLCIIDSGLHAQIVFG